MVSEDCASPEKAQVHVGAASEEAKTPPTVDQRKSGETAKKKDLRHQIRDFDFSKAFEDMEKEEEAEKMARRQSLKRRQAQRAMIRAFGDLDDSGSE